MYFHLSIHNKLRSKLFRHFVKLLNREHIPFWLDFDTLLGVWSVQNGIDRSREKYIYISIHQVHLTNLQDALKKLGFLYRVNSISNRSGKKWIHGSEIGFSVFNSWKQTISSFKIIISIKYKHGTDFRWIDVRNCKHISKKYYNNFDNIRYNEKKYNIPSNTDEYLNKIYRKWKAIPHDWHHQIDDGTLVRDDLIATIANQPIETRLKKDNIKLHEKGNHVRMKRMLLFAIDQLQKNNIPFWLEAGTLLGIIRDGKLIPWDYDADLSIPAEYADKVAALWLNFLPKYNVKKRKSNSRWIPEDTRVVKIKTTWERLLQVNFHIDLFCVYKVKNKYRWSDSGVLKHVDAKYFDKQDYINWEGRTIPIPAFTEDYLKLRYGDWQTPNQQYIASIHDGAIAERGF